MHKKKKLTSDELLARDYDGNTYKTVEIGAQVWMTENVKVTHYQDGTPIPNVSGDDARSKLTTGALCWYENNQATYKDVYGALYNDTAVIDSRKLCPAGWHIPTKAEWLILENALGGKEIAGGKMKYFDSRLWKAIATGSGNESGFSGIPAGGRGRVQPRSRIEDMQVVRRRSGWGPGPDHPRPQHRELPLAEQRLGIVHFPGPGLRHDPCAGHRHRQARS